jgi:BirA family biotin operon repressor/biotin-[acetyl-CoA-carboxylase] ligase
MAFAAILQHGIVGVPPATLAQAGTPVLPLGRQNVTEHEARLAHDTLSAQAITEGLMTRCVGQKVLCYESVTSTMEVARRAAREGAPEGTVVIAEEQTAGKGRLKRAWLTPRGNIALSVILRPSLSTLPSLIMLASLAAVHAIETVTHLRPVIKWPNDILINGRKVGGILIENDIIGARVSSVIGIGLDVSLKPADYPEIAAVATSLSEEAGAAISRLEVVRSLLVSMERLLLRMTDGESLFEEWRDRLVTLGKEVRATTPDAVCEGIAESVDTDGSLLVRGPGGELVRIVAGDVTLRG